MQPWASGRVQHKPDDLNYFNRPVRTGMPGGVGGDRSGIMTAPYPDLCVTKSGFLDLLGMTELKFLGMPIGLIWTLDKYRWAR